MLFLYDTCVGLNYEAMEMLERALVACERNKSLGKDALMTIEIAFETAKMHRKTGTVPSLTPMYNLL